MKIVEEISKKYSVDIDLIKLIDTYLEKMLVVNKRINLTSIKDLDVGRVLHIEDSIIGFDKEIFSNCNAYADIGSGCGFPGIVLAIISGVNSFLIDSNGKKMKAVQNIVDQLEIGNVSCINSRIEELDSEYKELFDVVSARALSQLSSILELASPITKPNGYFIAFKSNIDKEELKRGNQTADIVGFSPFKEIETKLIDGSSRKVLVYIKDHNASVDLPRRNGLAQKRPL